MTVSTILSKCPHCLTYPRMPYKYPHKQSIQIPHKLPKCPAPEGARREVGASSQKLRGT